MRKLWCRMKRNDMIWSVLLFTRIDIGDVGNTWHIDTINGRIVYTIWFGSDEMCMLQWIDHVSMTQIKLYQYCQLCKMEQHYLGEFCIIFHFAKWRKKKEMKRNLDWNFETFLNSEEKKRFFIIALRFPPRG